MVLLASLSATCVDFSVSFSALFANLSNFLACLSAFSRLSQLPLLGKLQQLRPPSLIYRDATETSTNLDGILALSSGKTPSLAFSKLSFSVVECVGQA